MDEYMRSLNRNKDKNLSCLHSRKISFIIDQNNEEKKKLTASKHYKTCTVCQNTWESLQRRNDIYTGNIPLTYPNKSQIVEFRNELKDLMNGLRIVDKKSVSYRLTKSSYFLRNLARDVREVVTSENMVKVYMLSVVLGVTLKFLL